MDSHKVKIVRVSAAGRTEREETVVREQPLTIYLNGRELVTMLCSPMELDALAVGFLGSEGLLSRREDIKNIAVDEVAGLVRVTTVAPVEPAGGLHPQRLIALGGGRGLSFLTADIKGLARIESTLTFNLGTVLALVDEFQHYSQTFRQTGGVHGAALCDTEKVLVFAEDIGRHNAIDKVFGRCLLEGLPVADRIILTSGRVSSEILLKVARWGVPVLVSVAAPTDVGVALADKFGMTLIGFVRSGRMNVYTHDWRVK